MMVSASNTWGIRGDEGGDNLLVEGEEPAVADIAIGSHVCPPAVI